MENSRASENQTTLCQRHEAFGIPDGKTIFTISTPKQTALHRTTKNNVSGFSEDLHFKQLISENQYLKKNIEELTVDKLRQAQRITELNEEKSRLKKALADLILNIGIGIGSP